MNEDFCILIRISLKFVLKSSIGNTSALVQVMTGRRTGDKCWPSSPTYVALGGDEFNIKIFNEMYATFYHQAPVDRISMSVLLNRKLSLIDAVQWLSISLVRALLVLIVTSLSIRTGLRKSDKILKTHLDTIVRQPSRVFLCRIHHFVRMCLLVVQVMNWCWLRRHWCRCLYLYSPI